MNANPAPIAPALWRQLTLSAIVLQAVRAGESGTAALSAVEPGLRPGVQAIVFHVLRWLGRAQALRQQLAPRAPPAQVDALLCTALALAWREQDAPYEAFTLVDQAVEAAKCHPGTRRQASFINACLRRFLRERAALVAATDSDPVAVWNHPRWWIARLRQDHPAHWQEILRASNTHAPMTLRVNEKKVAVAQYLHMLEATNIEATPAGRSGAVLHKAMPVGAVPGFAQGLVSVQDAAAQRAAPLLLAGWEGRVGLHVLDACAAPGGKTAHLLELLEARVTALDIDPARCERIHENLQRLGLHAGVVAADAMQPGSWWAQHCASEPFDAILLDAPCTASGIVRRHPDVRWLRRESDIDQLTAIQAALLAALWPLLKPGGRLLYCTCSVFKAEGYDQIQTFVTHNTDAALRPSPGHLMPQIGANSDGVPDNRSGDHDGFFYALLEKRAA
ncbi:MAG: 16S rRNA (cytosine(967)-C(5))-methyltransferase RsmB [Rhodoferax sp.]